ncbi:RNA polymerase sigma-70 factor, ECF subfamily [Pedobacter steynii]|uniref:RNA polymerase sigma-70 factor, ECF subfamily n=1 Tax=Pedobacter steynii TaxID=430522 RepID=A0A1G9V0W7_9SPHI|nr:sigma-70 family RNA polymerase sigma factor [Pedobacter steynii]NQX40948.1 sigma-70 family RNA polymerase sigma factor [Pedobacter steynii]SDM65921.1 RNA polymerase sigma-70 factor, ECF subfamily [Pedobacter steynii]
MRDEDQILLDRLRTGDQSAYEAIFKKYYKMLSAKAYFMLDDEMEAEDLVQTLFVSIWQKARFHSINTSLNAYLLRAVHNQCIMCLRKRKVSERRLNEYSLSLDEPIHEEAIESDRNEDTLNLAFNELPSQRQKAFKLVYMEDKKYKEAAHEMGLSVNSIKTHLKLAVKALQKKLINFK